MKPKGRGATANPDNRFLRHTVGDAFFDDPDPEEHPATKFIEVFPKSILNEVTSPDVPLELSLNPYQGCEHGCSYCYARNSHEYWGYSAGLDFERVVLYKTNAPQLLSEALRKKSHKVRPIMLSGNTDCYQPVERRFGLTRQCLVVLQQFGHPVGVITKNSLVERDIDILGEMAQRNLARVAVSITTLDESLRQRLEPRTASVQRRLNTVQRLSEAGIPVFVMMAPIIPGLNSSEVMAVAEAAAQRGALGIGHQMVRLNGQLGQIFEGWLNEHYPDRKEKVLSLVRQTHGGQLNDNRFGARMKGEGPVATQVAGMMQVAKKKFFNGRTMPEFDLAQSQVPGSQLSMF